MTNWTFQVGSASETGTLGWKANGTLKTLAGSTQGSDHLHSLALSTTLTGRLPVLWVQTMPISPRVCSVGLWFILVVNLAFTQPQKPVFSDPTAPPFLVRLQRTTSDRDVCALIRGDGLFHLERETVSHFEVSEGVLDDSELADVKGALNERRLAELTQQRITVPLLTTGRDTLNISILRSPFTQNLTFMDRESRRPFYEFITPLLRWIDALQKHSHTTLDEYSGRNNCMPPRKIEFSPRPLAKSSAEGPPVSQPVDSRDTSSPPTITAPKRSSFLMRWQFNHIAEGTVQDTCVVVYASGRYRMEKISEGYRDKLKVRAFEDSLRETDLKELQDLLDRPELKVSTHQNSASGKIFREGEFTALAIARDGHLQQLSFASYFGVPGSVSNLNSETDPEERVVASLRKWLKAYIETRKGGVVKDAAATHCAVQETGP